MVQPDSIQTLTDSVTVLQSDSLLRIDSIALADSLRVVDSLKVIAQMPKGFIGIPHPSLPQTEDWVFLTLFALFLILVSSISRSAGLFTDTIKNFFQVKERTSIFSKATVNDFRFRFFIILFSICVLSLYAYNTIHAPSSPFLLKEYGVFLAATLLFFGIKSILFDILGYVFLDKATLKMSKETYFNIVAFLGVLLYPFLVLGIYLSSDFEPLIELICLILCISAYLLLIIKLFQIFFQKIVASFYILLYLCTLEFLPLIALYQVYKLIL